MSTSERPPIFKTPRGAFRGKPARARYNKYGLTALVVCPTRLDLEWTFSDEPCKDDAELLDRMQQPPDPRSAEQRLQDSVRGLSYESCEIGVQCFEDGRWPSKTDLKCWWCLHGFDTRPFPCPYRKSVDGKWHIVGVFCGPSCAKAWAVHDGRFLDAQRVPSLIDELARSRGFCSRPTAGATTTIGSSSSSSSGVVPKGPVGPHGPILHIPEAPPRTVLKMFRGEPDGLTIEQFRGLCSCGFDVRVLEPPYITHKQVLVAEHRRLMDMAKTGRICHVESSDSYALTALELARQRREGVKIFAGIGVRRLDEFFGKGASASASAAVAALAATRPMSTTTTITKTTVVKTVKEEPHRAKRPLPPTTPAKKQKPK